MLLTLAGECGFDAVASEIRSDVAQGLRNIGIEVLEDTIENLAEKAPGSFDVISMCDVLEHVAFPLPTLDAVIRLLRPGGVLVISCPNRESKAWTSLSEIHENPYWAEIEHFHNFSFRQIKGWLLERGFTRVHCGVSPRYRLCMEVVAVF